MNNILFLPAISTLGYTSANDGQELWRVATKTSNTYDNRLTMEMLFNYENNPGEFEFEGSYMTLFHMGANSSSKGYSVVLKEETGTNDIYIGVLYSTGSNWVELTNPDTSTTSFKRLSDITTVSTQGFYIMFQYDLRQNIAVASRFINFYVKSFGQDANPASTSTPDFSFTYNGTQTGFPNLRPVGGQWGFGSLPQAIPYNSVTNPEGYNNTNNYNGYVAQNLSLFYLRTWSILVPVSSTTSGEYAMFNTTDSTHSLYYLNQTFTQITPTTSYSNNLDFQLLVPDDSSDLSLLENNAILLGSPPEPQLVTTTTSTTNYQTLNPGSNLWNFAVNSNTNYIIITVSDINCILKGTKILTPDGNVPIENIKVGDFIITHDGRKKEVIKTHFNSALHNKNTQCIVIKKGTFGAEEDLYLSKNHAILIGDEFIIPDRKMPNEIEYISSKTYYTYYSLMTEDYLSDSLVANGVAIETWGGYLPWIKGFKYKEPVIRNKERNRILKKTNLS